MKLEHLLAKAGCLEDNLVAEMLIWFQSRLPKGYKENKGLEILKQLTFRRSCWISTWVI